MLLVVSIIIILILCFKEKVKYYAKRIVDHIVRKCYNTTSDCPSRDTYTSVSAIEDDRIEAEGMENGGNMRHERSNNGAVHNGTVRSNSEQIRNRNIGSNGDQIHIGTIRGNGETIRNFNIRSTEKIRDGNYRRISYEEDIPVLEADIQAGNNILVAQGTTQASVYSNRCHTNPDGQSDRQPISGSIVLHDRDHNIQNARQISDQDVRRELSSPVGSNCQPAMEYISPCLDTGYNSAYADLDQTHLKQSQNDRNKETKGDRNQLKYERNQQINEGLPASFTSAPIDRNDNVINVAQDVDSKIGPASS